VRKVTKAAIAALGLSLVAGPAFAENLGVLSPGAVGATVVGSSEVVVHVPQTGERAMTIAPIDVTNIQQVNAFPGTGQLIDMSGGDGSLRSCYANGGIAKQGQDLAYRCEVDTSNGQGPLGQQAASSQYVTPTGLDTGYDGVNNVEDPALLDCMNRGGSLIQLSSNGQFACAM
jgi:hypothetical protein